MSYIVIRSFYEGDTLHEQGKVFEHGDAEYIEKCLADENIADSENPEAAAVLAEATRFNDYVEAEITAEANRHEPTPTTEPDQPIAPVETQQVDAEPTPTTESDANKGKLFGLI